MSVAKLLLSGLLVASGIIIGAFALHARFAPQWEVQASAGIYGKAQPVDVVRVPHRATAREVPDNWEPRLIRSEPKPPTAMDDAAKAKKRQTEKKITEKQQTPDKAKQQEETVFSWLTGLLYK
jgi:hypothetical protein